MSPMTRARLRHDFVPNVLKAVKLLEKEHGQGVSRQNIEKYFAKTLDGHKNQQDKLMPQVVKAALRTALNSGLLVHARGVGLNGSFMIPTTFQSRRQKGAVVTEESRMRNISSLVLKQDTRPATPEKTSKPTDSDKRRRSTTFAETFKSDLFKATEKSKALKTILKTPRRKKVVSKLVKGKRVKFSSPPKVIFFSPRIKRKAQRKK
ncbi:histone H1.0-like [Montipora capricornis]|uniref:histone H1.0-like n=1 Tax=Montipora capricornis TaxID=246305 RepID=UPI0035F146AA